MDHLNIDHHEWFDGLGKKKENNPTLIMLTESYKKLGKHILYYNISLKTIQDERLKEHNIQHSLQN